MTDDTNATIALLKARVREFCAVREWDEFHSAKELAIGIATEAGELLQHFRFQSSEDEDRLLDDPTSRKEIEQELADVFIFVLRFGERFDFDLTGAVERKLAANGERYPVSDSKGSNRKAGRDS